MKKFSIFLSVVALGSLLAPTASADVSKAYVSDLGNGKYQNPVINADYSDPDVVRVGDDYYMTS
ncbi:MAG: glycoside hydrolase, partial [Muribaculaceae bacterium]|nr:glycoside hydrolase [Muribaculaceae bacterium]